MKTIELNNPDRQVVFDWVADFTVQSQKVVSDLLIVNTNVFYNPYDDIWYGTITYYDA